MLPPPNYFLWQGATRVIMNDMTNVEGGIDLTDEQHISDAWKGEGETVDVKDNTNTGQETNSFWPKEIENPENDMTELQRETVRMAILNQTLDSDGVGNKIGKDGGYVRATLKRVCPEWYNSVFKPSTTKVEGGNVLEKMASECSSCKKQIVLHEKLNGEAVMRCQCEEVKVANFLPQNWLRDF